MIRFWKITCGGIELTGREAGIGASMEGLALGRRSVMDILVLLGRTAPPHFSPSLRDGALCSGLRDWVPPSVVGSGSGHFLRGSQSQLLLLLELWGEASLQDLNQAAGGKSGCSYLAPCEV